MFTILAPCWFSFEWFISGHPNDDGLKYAQDLGSRIWIAVATVMLAMYFGKDLARESHPQNPVPCVNVTTGK